MNAHELLPLAEQRIAQLENISRIQIKQIERLLDAREVELGLRKQTEACLERLAAAAARIVEDDAQPTLVHHRALNRARQAAVKLLGNPNQLQPVFEVTVEVSGGVAEVTRCPAAVNVTIEDHD